MSTGFASNYRTGLLAVGVFGCFTALGARLYCLHVLDRNELVSMIATARQQVIVEKAVRGNILDSRSAILATSRAVYVLGFDPVALRQPVIGSKPEDKRAQKLYLKDRAKWGQLAALLEMSEEELEEILTDRPRVTLSKKAARPDPASTAPADLALKVSLTPPAAAATEPGQEAPKTAPTPRWRKLREDISPETLAEVEKLEIRGIYAPPPTFRRVYPHKQLGAHVLGYVNVEEEPVSGVERFADFYLRGQDGWRVGEKDGNKRELAQFRSREVPPANGYSVMLSLDANVQDIIERELADIAEKYQPLKATIIVSDPRDGFILGLANYPTFDPNEYNLVPPSEIGRLSNVALSEVYEPGSVFKIVAASGALEERLVTPASSFDCGIDRIEYKGKVRGLPKEDHPFGRLTVAEIIAHSSNRGAAQLAMQLGDQRFYEYARAFGFGQRSGLLGSLEKEQYHGGKEEKGNLRWPEMWDGVTITRLPMGQSLDVTPLQMHEAMSMIASGGVRLRPQIVREVRDTTGKVVYRFGRTEMKDPLTPPHVGPREKPPAPETRRFVSPQTAATMARLLTAVASKEGTAPEAAIPGYEVAGKTGTTQKLMPITLADGRVIKAYSTRDHVASFVGFFPASNPQVVISVIVDGADAHAPGGVAYGAKIAAPAFKRIGEQLITYRDIKTSPVPTGGVIAMQGHRQ